MYSTHQPLIAEFALASSENLARVLTFSMASARQKFYRMPYIMYELQSRGHSRFLVSSQNEAAKLFYSERNFIEQSLVKCQTPKDRMYFLTTLKRIGMVKAGFACQLVFGEVGCIDIHNIRRYQFEQSELALTKNPFTNKRRIGKYIRKCHEIGTEQLWNTWCKAIWLAYPSHYYSAEHVSALHVTVITGKDV